MGPGLLISTPMHILFLDPVSGINKSIRSGDGYYYGMTHKDGTMVLSHSEGYLGIYGNEVKRTKSHLIQPHQLEWVEDKILVTNTGKNCISVFDEHGELIRDVYLNDVRWDDKDQGRQGNHFNSVHYKDGVVYIIAHNYDRPSELWSLSWPDLEVMETTAINANWAHNFWAGEYGFVTCNSRHGSLVEISSGETLWSSDIPDLITRGLAVSEDHIFIGGSGMNVRKDRYWKNGHLWIVDRKTLKTLNRFTFPGSGDVHDIRIIGAPDACHNHQTIPHKAISQIEDVNRWIELFYGMRKAFPFLRKDVFLVSPLLRALQLINRKRSSNE